MSTRTKVERNSIRRSGGVDLATAGGGGTPTQIDIGDAAVVGVSGDAAHADHQHALPVPTIINAVGVASLGVSTIPAREDHVHQGVSAVNGGSGDIVGAVLIVSPMVFQNGSTIYINNGNSVTLNAGFASANI